MLKRKSGRPPDDYIASLQKRAKKADYDRLALAACEAMLNGENSVFVAFHHTVRFPDDFPKGVLVDRTEKTDIRKMRAKKVYDWLYEHGHVKLPRTDIIIIHRQFSTFFKHFDDMDVDISQEGEDNVNSVIEEDIDGS